MMLMEGDMYVCGNNHTLTLLSLVSFQLLCYILAQPMPVQVIQFPEGIGVEYEEEKFFR